MQFYTISIRVDCATSTDSIQRCIYICVRLKCVNVFIFVWSEKIEYSSWYGRCFKWVFSQSSALNANKQWAISFLHFIIGRRVRIIKQQYIIHPDRNLISTSTYCNLQFIFVSNSIITCRKVLYLIPHTHDTLTRRRTSYSTRAVHQSIWNSCADVLVCIWLKVAVFPHVRHWIEPKKSKIVSSGDPFPLLIWEPKWE